MLEEGGVRNRYCLFTFRKELKADSVHIGACDKIPLLGELKFGEELPFQLGSIVLYLLCGWSNVLVEILTS